MALTKLDKDMFEENVLNTNITARNTVYGQLALSQGQSQRVGFSATTYTGNGSTQSINTGVDMDTGDFAGLVGLKQRDGTNSHALVDTVRGTSKGLSSNSTAAENTFNHVTSFNPDGFSVGTSAQANSNNSTYVSWSWQTTEKFTGTTNRNKAYTSHYNPQLGFSIVGYEGDGVAGHEIPHHLGRVPELSIIKNRTNAGLWAVFSSFAGDPSKGDYLRLENTVGLANDSNRSAMLNIDTSKIGSTNDINKSTDDFIQYNFTSIEGVSKVGKYIGTGATGNYVDCGFKPAWVMVKKLSDIGNWIIIDSARSSGNGLLFADLSNAESVSTTVFNFAPDGFVLLNDANSTNDLNDEYLFLAFADTNSTTGRTDYDYPTAADTLSIENGTLISHANGFNANGEVNLQELVPSATTMTFGTGFEDSIYYVYKNQGGSYGTTEHRPLENQDYSGVQSPLSFDKNMRTTAQHFDYESSTGVASASGEASSAAAYNAFTTDKVLTTKWTIENVSPSRLQYKFTEKRVLKSWRIKSTDLENRDPKRFTIEGSNDGFVWTAVDSTYTASDYTGNGVYLWGDIQLTSSNNTAYLYYHIDITAVNGSTSHTSIGKLEFNTILPSDLYDVTAGTLTDYATQAAVVRTYLGSVKTDTNGDITQVINNPVAKVKGNDAEYHGDVKVHGELKNRGVATAWVNYDGTQNPPLINNSYNIKAVVDLSPGRQRLHFETLMDSEEYTVVCSGDASSGAITVAPFRLGETDLNSIEIRSYNSSAQSIDCRSVDVLIFGGKE